MLLLLLQADAGQDYTLSAAGASLAISGSPVAEVGFALTADPLYLGLITPSVDFQTLDFQATGGSLTTTFPSVSFGYDATPPQGAQTGSQGGGGGGKALERGGAKIERWDAVELEDIYDELLGIKKPDPVVKAAIKAVERISGERRPEPASVDWEAVAADAAAAQALIEAEDALDAFEAMEALLTMLAWDEAA